MTVLEKKRMEKELMQVTAARYDMEIRIEEMQLQITMLQKNIDVQLAKEDELKQRLIEKK